MQVNGIIAEYNPFHNGHKYHLEESLRRTGADYTVVVMSGNFVQRGEPALFQKRIRTQTALCCGADLVLELPVLYATSSAEYFADGAAALLDKLGVVTHLCFGSECGDAALLKRIADLLTEEPPEYRLALKNGLRQGLTYPQARVHGLTKLLQDPELDSGNIRTLQEVLSGSNNILGIDYIRALSKRHSSIRPITIYRQGAGYNDAVLHNPVNQISSSIDSEVTPLEVSSSPCSALAIRRALLQGIPFAQLRCHMPPEAAAYLENHLSSQRLVTPDSFSTALHYKLLLEEKEGFEKYLDVSTDLSNRIVNNLKAFTGFTAFCELLKTKNMTYSRISRCLLHILLGLEKKDMEFARAIGDVPYTKVLGFRRAAAPLLHAIRSNSSIPLVTKLADAGKILAPEALQMLEWDLLATRIYHGAAAEKSGGSIPNETATPLVIL